VPAAVRLLLAACAAAAMLLPAGCGGGGPDTTSAGAGTVARRPAAKGVTTTTPRKRLKQAESPRHAAAGSSCQGQLGGFVGSMDSLRRRLAVGVTYDQYVNEVDAIRSTYARIPAEEVAIDCLAAVGTPAEKAFNRYIEAANDWGGCVSEAGCESGAVEPALQRRWRIASHFLAEAENGLRASTR
jgi:hypothetical protein